MSGYVEQAAEAFISASQMLPVEHVVAASGEIPPVVSAIHQAGGPAGQELAQVALTIQTDLELLGGRLQELRQRLDGAAQAVLRGGT